MAIEFFYQATVFMFGMIVGSFLNVCIVRMPEEKSVIFPSSHCPSCKKSLKWFHNIPFISWLFLRGKCSFCNATISWRYPFVELLTGVIFLVFFRIFGFDWILLPYLTMISGFIVATFVDFKHRIIPDEISVGGMLIGILMSLFVVEMHDTSVLMIKSGAYAMRFMLAFFFIVQVIQCLIKRKIDEDDKFIFMILICFAVVEALLTTLIWIVPHPFLHNLLSFKAGVQGAFIGGGVIYFMGVVGELIFRKEAMGGGDVKLLAMIGAFIGWKLAILTFFIAPFFGAIVGIIEKIRTKDSTLAYGPYICLGAVISIFWGETILDLIITGRWLP